jgi:hypothetical protein
VEKKNLAWFLVDLPVKSTEFRENLTNLQNLDLSAIFIEVGLNFETLPRLPLVRLWDQREDFRATSSVQFDVQELGNCGARLTWLLPHVPALQIYSSASIQAAPLAQSAREERTHKHIPAAPLA